MQLSVYQGINASNVFGVVCLYNDEEFFMLFVRLFLFKLYQETIKGTERASPIYTLFHR